MKPELQEKRMPDLRDLVDSYVRGLEAAASLARKKKLETFDLKGVYALHELEQELIHLVAKVRGEN